MNTQGWHCTGCNQHVYFPHYCQMNSCLQPQTYQYPPFIPTNQQLMEQINILGKKLDEILGLLNTQKDIVKVVPRGY